MSTQLAERPTRLGWRRLVLLLVLCGAAFIEGIDIAMLNVAVPSIKADLDIAGGSLHWVVSAYVLGYGGFLLLGGRSADLLGRRRMFLAFLAVFVVFSGLGGLANDEWLLIVARFVTGICAAFMAPAGLSIITTSFPEGAARNRALIIYGATGAAGFTLGLAVGGLLTTISWRWVFFAPVILALLLLIAAVPLVEKDEPPAARGMDVAGALTISAAMLALIFGVTQLEKPSLVSAAAFVAGGVLLAAFVAIERRSRTPLIRLGILRSGSLVRANVAALLFSASFFGFQFLVTLYLQELRHWTPLQTSLVLLLVGVDAILAPTLTPMLVNRFGTLRVAVGGLAFAVLSYALFLPVGNDWTYAAMFPSMLLLGLAFTFAFGPLTIVATDGVPAHEQGLASGLIYTSFEFGAAIGLSMVTVVRGENLLVDGYRAALAVPLAAALIATAVLAIGLRRVTHVSRH
jgi:MFS family permease